MVDTLKTIIIFVGIGIPLIVLVVSLLSASNDAFARTVNEIFSFNFDFGINVARALFVVFVSAYIVSDIYFLKQYKKAEKSVNREVSVSLPTSKIFLRAAGLTLVILNIFYLFFCLSELGYDYGNARTLLIQKGLDSYSQFAVSRFWELITVGIINLAIFYFLTGSYKKLNKDNSRILRPLILGNFIVLFVNSLGLILSVNARLFLYESGYGLTDKRLYAHLFIFILAVIFVLFLIGVFVKNHTRLQLASITVLFLFFSIYTALPTDYFIAKANYELAKSERIDRYDPLYDASIDYCPNISVEKTMLPFGTPSRGFEVSDDGLFVVADLLRENTVHISPEERSCLEYVMNNYDVDDLNRNYSDDDIPQLNVKWNWREWNLSRYLLQQRIKQTR